MIRGYGIGGGGGGASTRTKVWAHDAFLAEFGAQNGSCYVSAAANKEVHDVWLKYAALIRRLVHVCEDAIVSDEGKALLADIVAKDKARFETSTTNAKGGGGGNDDNDDDYDKLDDDDDDDSVRGMGTQTGGGGGGMYGPRRRGGGDYYGYGNTSGGGGGGYYGSARTEVVNADLEKEQTALLYTFTSLLSETLAIRAVPVLKRIARVLDRCDSLMRLAGNYVSWRMNYYLAKIVEEIVKTSRTLLREEGDFMFVPILLNVPPTSLLATEGTMDVTLMMIEYEGAAAKEAAAAAAAAADDSTPATTAAKAATANSNEPTFRLTIINSSPLTDFHPKSVQADARDKIKQQVGVTISGVARSKIFSEAWWSCVYLMTASIDENMFYTHMLSWLTGDAYADQITKHLNENTVGSALKFSDASIFWSSLTYSLKHTLARFGQCSRDEVKLCRYVLRLGLISEMKADLGEMKRVKELSKINMRNGLKGITAATVRNESRLSVQNFEAIRTAIQELAGLVEGVASDEESRTTLPPAIDITNGWDQHQQLDAYPLMECFRRIESTEPFAGSKIERPKVAPVNLLRVRPRVRNFIEALHVIDELLLLCVRISMQEQSVKNSYLMIYSAIAEAFVEVLPPPLGPDTKKRTGLACVWSDFEKFPETKEGLRYGQQCHLLKRLRELAQYFYIALTCIQDKPTEVHLEAIRLTVVANISAIADAVLRVRVTDCPSVFSQHYIGLNKGRGTSSGERAGFAIDAGNFARVSADCVYVYPEALMTRQGVLDYFDETSAQVPPTNVIWRFKNGLQKNEASNIKFLTQICKSLNLTYSPQIFASVEGNHSTLCRNCPDFRYFRDITIFFRSLAMRIDFTNMNANWAWDEEMAYQQVPNGFMSVSYIGRPLDTTYVNVTKSWAHVEQYVSNESAKRGLAAASVSEEDLLHTMQLGDLGALCGMRDAELLLSYLTAPYLRIPLVLRFFATEDRASLLRFNPIQRLITCALFDAGQFLPAALSGVCPKMVPTENDRLIACPYGLLLNELCYNPLGVVEPLLRLLNLILEMDSGNVLNDVTMDTICFIARTVGHVFSYLRLASRLQQTKNNSKNSAVGCVDKARMRDINTQNEEVTQQIEEGYSRVKIVILTKILPIFCSWIDELETSTKNVKLDVVCMRVSAVRQDLILLTRGLEGTDLRGSVLKNFLSAILFLTTRYTWRKNGIQEVLVFQTAHMHRRAIAKHLSMAPKHTLGDILNTVVKAVTRAGKESATATEDSSTAAEWGIVAGVDCVARFCRLGEETSALLDKQNKRLAAYSAQMNKPLPADALNGNYVGSRALTEMAPSLEFAFANPSEASASSHAFALAKDVMTIPNGIQDVEVNLHTYTVTFKNAHLQQLPDEIAGDSSLKSCDGLFADPQNVAFYDPTSCQTINSTEVIASLQCAVVDETVHRVWVRLVAQDADIISWKTPDPRMPLPATNSLRFYPDDLTDVEKWVYDIFEPVRQSYLERSFWEPPIFILLPDRKLTAENSVALVSAVDSATGKKLKECYVFRDFGVVHFYDVFSHARRFYRSLAYSTDDRYTLFHQNISTDGKTKLPPEWARYECGDPNPDESQGDGQSISIIRHPFHPLNKSGSRETFIPQHLLHGLVPETLLDEYSFWQDDDDNIRGYPLTSLASGQIHESGPTKAARKVEEQKKSGGGSLSTKTKSKGRFSEAVSAAHDGDESASSSDEDEDTAAAGGAKAASSADKRSNHLLWIHWRELKFDPTGEKNTCVRIVRFENADECPRSSEGAVRMAYKNLHVEYETEEDLDNMKKDAEALMEDDMAIAPEDLEAGAYQQSPAAAAIVAARNDNRDQANASIDGAPLLLVNLMYAREGTPLHSLAKVLAQIETLASVVVWTRDVDYDPQSGVPMTLDLISLPKLKLSFAARLSSDQLSYAVYSLDHSHLYISNLRPSSLQGLMQGIPFGLVMADVNNNLSILVPSLKVVRLSIRQSPFSTFIVPVRTHAQWTNALETRYYLYPVHVSLSFLFTPTLASALYLLELRLMARLYKEAFTLAGSIGSDVALTREEKNIFSDIGTLYSNDPNGMAAFARISLAITDAPIEPAWYPPRLVTRLLAALPYVDIDCRLSSIDERRLLHACEAIERKMEVIRNVSTTKFNKSGVGIAPVLIPAAQLAIGRIQNPAQQVTTANMKQIRKFYQTLMNTLREKLDVRVPVDEVDRLLIVYSTHARAPLRQIFTCLLHNRCRTVESECTLATAGTALKGALLEKLPKTIRLSDSTLATLQPERVTEAMATTTTTDGNIAPFYNITIEAKVPTFGKEMLLVAGRKESKCQILQCRLPIKGAPPMKNKEGRNMTPSPIMDVYYCGLKDCRGQGNKCPCGSCDKTCGTNNAGCPCPSCRLFNTQEGRLIRQLPELIDLSSSRATYQFFDIFGWVQEVLRAFAVKPDLNQKVVNLNGPPQFSCRNGQNFVRFYEFATGTSKVKISNSNCARDMAQILWPLTYDSRLDASGLGHLLNFIVFHPDISSQFYQLTQKEIRNEKHNKIMEKIYDTARGLAAKLLAEANKAEGGDAAAAVPDASLQEGADASTVVGEDTLTQVQSGQEDSAVLPPPPPPGQEEGDAAEGLENDDGEGQEGEPAEGILKTRRAELQKKIEQIKVAVIPNQGTFDLQYRPRLAYREHLGVPIGDTTVLPIPDNTDCSRRILSVPDLSRLKTLSGEESARLQDGHASDESIEHLCSFPLATVLAGLEGGNPVRHLSREQQELNQIPDALPFDLLDHDCARKTVAKDMMVRIASDMKVFADRSNADVRPKFVDMTTEREIRAIVTGKNTTTSDAIQNRVEEVLASLKALREADQTYLLYAMPVLERTANQLGTISESAAASPTSPVSGTNTNKSGAKDFATQEQHVRRISTKLALQRFAGKEATLSIDFIIASLATEGSERIWQQLNPFLDAETCDAVLSLAALVVLRANRIAHINRACDAATDLLSWLKKATSYPKQFKNVNESSASPALRQELESYRDAVVASLILKSDSLAEQLDTKRCYFTTVGERIVAGKKCQERAFDARFLLFEFTWSLVLRDRQRELITEMYDSVAKEQTSLVKQMIMGAGKTTVVGPLLGVMLADGSNLIMQVVPPALLDFTRAVMRTTFSSVMRKQIFTFTCDRAGEVDSEILFKFEHAKVSRGIVITTPNSIKSIFLKYLESLDKISDVHRNNRTIDDEKAAQDVHQVVAMWRKTVLVMDEVDLILHPLKSELNFPVGPKREIDYSPLRWKLPIHIIDAVFYCTSHRVTTALKDSQEGQGILNELRAAVEEGLSTNALQSTPHLTLLNTHFYEVKLKPVIAKWILLFIKAQLFTGLSDEDTYNYITRRPGLFSTAAQRAKANNTTIEAELSPEDERIQQFVARVAALDESHIKILNLAFEWLTCYLPHIWQKIDRVSYGIMNHEDMDHARTDNPHMPQSRFVTAIPFVGKDLPSQSSEFAHPDIVIGLTVLAYRYEGIRDMDFQRVMTDLYNQVESEVGKYSQRRTNLLFCRWIEAAGGHIVSSYNYKGGSGGQQQRTNGSFQQQSEVLSGTYEAGAATTKQAKIVDILPLKLLKQANTVEIAKVFKLLRKTAEVIHFYLSDCIFPEFMRHQHTKLSASGQELGGNIIFERRVGFSGTPSDLLPVELGHCAYERGTDGQLIYTLTNPEVMQIIPVKAGWTVKSVLNHIATLESPYRYNALIDTGALITGMSNKQVAAYLLRHGLKEMDGVVFLDELDRKMILVRATGRVLKLAECGIPKNRRFAFYDQVHTTGMDIEHIPNAVAVQTVGKDMTFRDFSQGAYRMRGIGVGQKVDLLLIPEVKDLINRSLATGCKKKAQPVADVSSGNNNASKQKAEQAQQLQDVTAWLLTNSMRSEHLQHDQLCLQSCANVWRKEAFSLLTKSVGDFSIATIDAKETEMAQLALIQRNVQMPGQAVKESTTAAAATHPGHMFTAGLSTEINTALNVFREPVVFNVNKEVPQLMLFSEIVEQLIDASRSLIRTDEGKSVVEGLLSQAKREDEVANPAVDVQVVQEQEEEKDKEQEEEKEQEVEIEKYVDLNYSRDSESQISWPLENIGSLLSATHFYPLSSFHLYKRKPLNFPDCIYLSQNFFNKRWSGHRRIRNVIAVLEWIPNAAEITIREVPSCDYASVPKERAFASVSNILNLIRDHDASLLETYSSGAAGADAEAAVPSKNRTRMLIKDVLEMALQRERHGSGAANSEGLDGGLDAEWLAVATEIAQHNENLAQALFVVLMGNRLRLEEAGRYFVCVSLAEAETLRRVIHLRGNKACLLQSQESSGTTKKGGVTALAIRAASCGFSTIDTSVQHVPARASFMASRAYQCLRFFDCDLHFTEREFGLLLRSLQTNGPKERQAFFQQVCGCRRRLRQRWERTPVAAAFVLQDAYSLLRQRAVGLCLRRFFERIGLSLGDAFLACNSSHSGVLSPAELWGGLRFCRLDKLTVDDVVDFIELVDSTHEGSVQYGDFIAALTGSKDEEDHAVAPSLSGGGEGSDNTLSREPTMEELQGPGDQRGAESQKKLPEIEPHGADALKASMSQRVAERRAAEAEALAAIEEENQRVMDVIEEEEIVADLAKMNETGNPLLLNDTLTFNFMMRKSDDSQLYGQSYVDELEGAKKGPGANNNNNKAKNKKKDGGADGDDDDDLMESGLLSFEERAILRAKRPMALDPPCIVVPAGNRARTTVDLDGRSCLAVHSATALNIPLRVLKKILATEHQSQQEQGGRNAATANSITALPSALDSYVLTAEVRFPMNATALSNAPAGGPEKPGAKKKTAPKKAAKKDEDNAGKLKQDADISILTKIHAESSNLSFAEWAVPLIECKEVPQKLIQAIFSAKADDDDDDDEQQGGGFESGKKSTPAVVTNNDLDGIFKAMAQQQQVQQRQSSSFGAFASSPMQPTQQQQQQLFMAPQPAAFSAPPQQMQQQQEYNAFQRAVMQNQPPSFAPPVQTSFAFGQPQPAAFSPFGLPQQQQQGPTQQGMKPPAPPGKAGGGAQGGSKKKEIRFSPHMIEWVNKTYFFLHHSDGVKTGSTGVVFASTAAPAAAPSATTAEEYGRTLHARVSGSTPSAAPSAAPGTTADAAGKALLQRMQASGSTTTTTAAAAVPPRPPRNVLRADTFHAVPKAAEWGLRIFREPRPPRTDDDILGYILKNDMIVATNTKTMNEINGVVFEWVQITSPCAGWVVGQRQQGFAKYSGPEAGSATSSALPALSANEPSFVPSNVAETKTFVNFFDLIHTRVLFEPNGNGLRIEHLRHGFDSRAAWRFMNPTGHTPSITISPSTQQECINDRELELGNVVTAVDEKRGGELNADVADLLNMIFKAKRLRPGDKVVRNAEHVVGRDVNLTEVGTVTSMDNENATVRWPGGNTTTMAWGKQGIFELIKVADAEDSDEDDTQLNEDGTKKRKYGGNLGGREPINDDRWLGLVKKNVGKHSCDNCGTQKLELGNWFRCNHCEDCDICRKCYRSGAHDEHDFTDMGALEKADADREARRGQGGEGDDAGAGLYVDAEVRVLSSLVAPRHGWGEDLNNRLEEQTAEGGAGRERALHWPSSLAGFSGIISAIDKAANTVTVTISSHAGDNISRMVRAGEAAEDGAEEEDPSGKKGKKAGGKKKMTDEESDLLNGPQVVIFTADPSEIEMERNEAEEAVAATMENPVGYANLFRMMPHLHYLASVTDQRIFVPSSSVTPPSSGSDEVKPLGPLSATQTETKVQVMKRNCPHLASLLSSATTNLLGTFKQGETIVRGRSDIGNIVNATAQFVCNMQRNRMVTLQSEFEKRLEKQRRDAAEKDDEKKAADDDEEDEEEKLAKQKREAAIAINRRSLNPEAIYNVTRLPVQVYINAALPYFLTDWTFTTQNRYGGVNSGCAANSMKLVDMQVGATVNLRRLGPEEKYEMDPSYIPPDQYNAAVGTVASIDMYYRSGNYHPCANVTWNIQYEWGGSVTNNVMVSDLVEVKTGQWYLCSPNNTTTTTNAATAALAAADAAEQENLAAAAVTSSSWLDGPTTAAERLFYDDFDDGNAVALPSAVGTLLERGLRDGTRMHNVFIRDDNYDVDLCTGEARRLKAPSERPPHARIDDELLDLTTMTREQRDQVSRLLGNVIRVPAEPFVAKEKPPAVDDGLTHLVSIVVQRVPNPNGDGSDTQITAVIDGKATPLQFSGCLSSIKDSATRSRMIAEAMRLHLHCPVALFSSTVGDLDGPVCNVYHVTLDYGLPSAPSMFGETRDLLADTIALHESTEQFSLWECAECKHAENSRLAAKCARCKKPRRARALAEQGSSSKFKAALTMSREAVTTRNRLQGKLKAQYQRELDTIDRAMEEMRNNKKRSAEEKKSGGSGGNTSASA